ncbi:Protein translocase subunit SecD [hydrothermal vent metagenome]|uniref:Protein translocase subunit SecD n=1 Tax=hydrothermal vent metagenome TaxID=652676 RepID=A0A3B1CZ57_9ZZZZ
MKNLRNRIIIIIGVLLAAIFFTFFVQKFNKDPKKAKQKVNINYGLDLKGGMHLVLKVDTEILDENAKKDAVLRAIEILRNRIDSIGVGETVIQRQGESEILIQLPGITDRDSAIKLIGQVAKLEFRLVNDDPNALKESLSGNTPVGYVLKTIKKEDDEPILLEAKVALSGETISDARVDFDQTGFGQPFISLTFNGQGKRAFARLTKENVGRRLAIIIDGTVLSAPNINEPILGGQGQITGQFTFEEASSLALSLRSGALPVPMHIEEERTIGPLLGKDSINAGITATTIGGALVLAFMLIYYLKAGIISNVALLLNLLLIFGTMGLLNALLPESQLTLTLPGIAGIILTLGMAVDANVLINERIREEIQNGRPLGAAVNSGFNKALKAIVDSNSTTLIAAFMLFQFGSGPIKGFAVTLSIGLIVSLFTALFVTRTIFNALIEFKLLKSLPMLSFFADTKINFVSKRFICFVLSIGLVVASIFVLAQKKQAAYGIDFVGGQIQEYRFTTPIKAEVLRDTLKGVNLDDAVIQQFEEAPENVIIRTSEDTYDIVNKGLKEAFPDNKFDILRIERVGPVVGKALRKAAIFAIIFALGGIFIFVGFRFKHFDFAMAGVIALLHDVFITLGLLVMMGRQVDLLVVTALLTIAGYSINDTIIIYDRVRENRSKFKKQSLADIINMSINQTLGRTILTTITTLLVVVTLFLKGGEVLNTFALCLMIGFIAGTYSTIFIASPLVLAWEGKKK